MYGIAVVSFAPLVLPVQCWTSGCSCEWLCRFGVAGCLTGSVFVGAALFALLSLLYELRSIEHFEE